MAFLLPEYANGEFAIVNDDFGEVTWCGPREYYVPADHAANHTVSFESGFWCHLSAPGYLDQTDWAGPYATMEEARKAIVEEHEVDPDTGERLEDAD